MDDSTTLLGYRGVYESFLWNVIEEGNAILAEIIRLSDFLPVDFHIPQKSKYNSMLSDFSYFSRSDYYEKLMAIHEELQDSFYSSYGNVLSRFEVLFQTIANFVISLNEYCEQVGDDPVSAYDLTRELEVESLYTLGLILLSLDKVLPGRVRERIYVAIYRNSDERKNVEFLVDLLRVSSGNEDTLFKRVKMNGSFVSNCLSIFDTGVREVHKRDMKRLRGRMAEVVYVCLFFDNKILHSDYTKMRQIVDHLFREQWVLNLTLNYTVNVIDEWQPYKAAFSSLTSHMDIARAVRLAKEHYAILADIDVPQGKLNPSQFSQHLALLTQYNSSMRWLILHSSGQCGKKGKPYMQAVEEAAQFEKKALLVVLKIANFELEFFKAYRYCVRSKAENVAACSTETCAIITEMADIFSQGFTTLKVEKRTKLQEWFLLMKSRLQELDVDNPDNTDLVMQIKRRISQVGEMLDLGGNLAMAQYLDKLQKQLDSLAAAFGVNEKIEERAEAAADAPYIWALLDEWTPRIQRLLLQSSNTQPVRALFSKLSFSVSVIANTLHSDERKRLISRAYSFYLEKRLRAVLQSVPNHLFTILHEIVIPTLQYEWTPHLDKAVVKSMADFDTNFRLAEATFTISNMSVGISRMALRKIGTIDVNPKELLEEGIRRELAIELPKLLATTVEKDYSLEVVLTGLTASLQSFQGAFIYMCDHVDVNGHEIWREQIAECLSDMATDPSQRTTTIKVGSSLSAFSFVLQLLYKATDPTTTRYSDSEMVWRSLKTKKETLSSKTMDIIEAWIPCFAVSSLETALSADLGSNIHECVMLLRSLMSSAGSLALDENLFVSKSFESLTKSVASSQIPLCNHLMRIGQLRLLRELLAESKRENGRLRAAPLFSALDSCNESLLSDSSDLPLDVTSLCQLMTGCALFHPRMTLFKIPSSHHSAFIALFILLLNVSAKLANSRRSDLCERSFLCGLFSLLHQLNAVSDFLTCSQLYIDSRSAGKTKQLPDSTHLKAQLSAMAI